MDLWEKVLRDGFLPAMSRPAVESLLEACRTDDPRLTQGSTTTPPPLMCVQNEQCQGACAVGFGGWQGEGHETVGDVEEYFARLCYECDKNIGEQAACRHFLTWFDDTPRAEALANLAIVLADHIEKTAVAA